MLPGFRMGFAWVLSAICLRSAKVLAGFIDFTLVLIKPSRVLRGSVNAQPDFRQCSMMA